MSIFVRAIDVMSNHTAADLRAFLADLANAAGILDLDTHLIVSENGTPNMSVNTAAGIAYILNSSWSEFSSDQRFWDVLNDATVNTAISANASGSTRIDRICLKIDTGVTPDANASNVCTVVSVEGTPGGGAPATPNDHLSLATVSVADGETAITDAMITDTRVATGISLGNVNLKSLTSNILVNDVNPDMIITLPVKAWEPTTTDGCADLEKIEAGTNDIDYNVLDFDKDSDESAFINFTMPKNWDGGVIQFRAIWTAAVGTPAQTVAWNLAGRAYADSGAIDQALGAGVERQDPLITLNDIHISPWSGDVTLAGSPSGGQWVHLNLLRDISEDNLNGDARLIGVQLRYKISQYGNL